MLTPYQISASIKIKLWYRLTNSKKLSRNKKYLIALTTIRNSNKNNYGAHPYFKEREFKIESSIKTVLNTNVKKTKNITLTAQFKIRTTYILSQFEKLTLKEQNNRADHTFKLPNCL